ncbi:MAG: acetylxylan esterase [Suilimivivens sp.]
MPLEELKRYTGSTPVPDDFWNFWDKMTKKAWSVPFSYEIIPSDLPQTSETEFFDVWLEWCKWRKTSCEIYKTKIHGESTGCFAVSRISGRFQRMV